MSTPCPAIRLPHETRQASLPVLTILSILLALSAGLVSPSAAAASDNVKVTSVSFYVNGTLTCSDASAPYSCAWPVPKGRAQIYKLKAKASDAAGNEGTSAVITVRSSL